MPFSVATMRPMKNTEQSMSPEFQELREGAALREVFDFAEGLTRERNKHYLPTIVHRLLHFTRGMGEMAKAVRVQDAKILPIISAKMVLRIFGVVEELGEIAEAALHLAKEPEKNLEKNKSKIISELAEAFAWLIGVCNHHEVNGELENAFRARYGKGCPNCGKYPCACEAFTYIDDRKDPRVKALVS